MSGVAVVTDSTSSLAPSLAEETGITVVPLQVVIDGRSRPESFRPGPGVVTPGAVAAALREGRSVSTSRPSPEAFTSAYEAAIRAGATAIVSVHLSSEISGTCDAASSAGAALTRATGVPVLVVDSETVGPGCGYAALTGASQARSGGSVEAVAEAARRRALGSTTWFCVENLEYLRRGGRIGTAQALLGSALAVKPLLTMVDGRISPSERVRTMSRALARLAELAGTALSQASGGTGASGGTEASGGTGADVTVLHLDNRSAADRLARSLSGSGPGVSVAVSDVSAVLGVHCGPGTIGVVVSPRG